MLKEFVEKNHYLFIEEVATWQEAVRLSCKSLEGDGTVDPCYAEAIIDCITQHGPYIVILPMVAMPHSTQNAKGVYRSEIGFMKVEKPVSFDPLDKEKDARLFFTLAAVNGNQHMDNIEKLMTLLMCDELVEALLEAKTPEDLVQLHEKYLD